MSLIEISRNNQNKKNERLVKNKEDANNLLRKLRNLFIAAASTIAMTSSALAQKHKGVEKEREPIEVTDKNLEYYLNHEPNRSNTKDKRKQHKAL